MGDPLAQLVEHNTFNVGVLGSSPKRITKNNPQASDEQFLRIFLCPKHKNKKKGDFIGRIRIY